MASTASPSIDQALGRAAKIFRLLKQEGMTDDDFQRIIDSKNVRLAIVKLFEDNFSTIPDDIDLDGVDRLLRAVFNRDWHGHSLPGIFEMYSSAEGLRKLTSDLDRRSVRVLIARYGLAGNAVQTLREIGNMLGVSMERVRQIESLAIHKMRQIDIQLRRLDPAFKPQARDGFTPIDELDLSERAFFCLKRAQVLSVEQLTQRTEDQLLAITNFGMKSLDEVIAKLDLRGLKLREA